MEAETRQFYESAARQSDDASVRQLIGDPPEEERKHESITDGLGAAEPDGEAAARKRLFVLQVVQPGLAGYLIGSS